MVQDRKKKVLLMYPPNQLMDIETPRPDGSLGPLYLAGYLESRGIETDILDASVGPVGCDLKDTFNRRVRQGNGLIRIGMSFDEIAQYVAKGNYTDVGVSSNFTPQTKMAFNTFRAIKQVNPEINIYAGGVNARALSEQFLRTGLLEGVCLSEGEIIFHNMLSAKWKHGSLEGVAGVAYVDNTGTIKNTPADCTSYPVKLDDLPMPAWHKLPFAHYDSLASPHGIDVTARQNTRYAPIMTSRGCPFSCAYCHISKEKGSIGKLRMHSEERVIQEIEYLRNMGIGKLFFEDDSLLADQDRILRILSHVKGNNLTAIDANGVNLMHFYDRKDPHNWIINQSFLESVAASGLQEIVFPVESANPRVVKKYATGKVDHSRMNVVQLMSAMVKTGLKCPVNMMIGFPDETMEEMQNSFEMSKKLIDAGAPWVTPFIPIPFTGSKLFDIAVAGGHLIPHDSDPRAAYDLDIVSWTDRLNWKNAVMENTAVPPAEVVKFRDYFYNEVNREDYKAMRAKTSAGHRYAQDRAEVA